jgi:hypothetical protein
VALGAAVFEVFAGDGGLGGDGLDVGEGGEAGEDAGEFFFFVGVVGGVEGGGEFADFFDEPAEGGPGAAFGVAGAVAGEDVLFPQRTAPIPSDWNVPACRAGVIRTFMGSHAFTHSKA